MSKLQNYFKKVKQLENSELSEEDEQFIDSKIDELFDFENIQENDDKGTYFDCLVNSNIVEQLVNSINTQLSYWHVCLECLEIQEKQNNKVQLRLFFPYTE